MKRILELLMRLVVKNLGYEKNLGAFNEIGCEYLEDIMS
jgi:hypothetical protein